jgi:lipopolysaccharide transport system ATP-binding protein
MLTYEVPEPVGASLEDADVLMSVRGVSKKFSRTANRSMRYMALDALYDLVGRRRPSGLRRDEFWALHGVSFELRRGQSLGIMGLNGAGKSTLLKLILGSLRLTEGEIKLSGRPAMLTEHGLGFDPLLTGRENVYLAAAVLGMDRRSVDRAFDDIVSFAELQDFIDSPVRGYSSGMRGRLGFSVATYLEPKILLVDEVLAVGDIGFQRRCIQHSQRYLSRGGSLVLVSHNPHLVQFLCDRCIVLDRGSVIWDGDAVEGVAQYLRATRTSPNDPLAFDPALADAPSVATVASGGDIEIDDYSMQPIDSVSLRTGESARVYVRYTAARNLEVRWGFGLLTADLATTITSEGLMDILTTISGQGEFTATIPRLPLVPGRYALRVAIMDPHTEMPYALGGFNSPPRYFTVEAPISRRNNYRMYTGDLIVLENLQWERRQIRDPDTGSAESLPSTEIPGP